MTPIRIQIAREVRDMARDAGEHRIANIAARYIDGWYLGRKDPGAMAQIMASYEALRA
jgi:hypothetical protein